MRHRMPHKSRTLASFPTIPAHIREAQDRIIHRELLAHRREQERRTWQDFAAEVKQARRKPRTRYKAGPVLWPGDNEIF